MRGDANLRSYQLRHCRVSKSTFKVGVLIRWGEAIGSHSGQQTYISR